jgi:hypothetical protein
MSWIPNLFDVEQGDNQSQLWVGKNPAEIKEFLENIQDRTARGAPSLVHNLATDPGELNQPLSQHERLDDIKAMLLGQKFRTFSRNRSQTAVLNLNKSPPRNDIDPKTSQPLLEF